MTDRAFDPKATPERVEMPARPAFDFKALSELGILWLINRVIFHPRGYALAIEYANGDPDPYGWSIQGDGKEPWAFPTDLDDEKFAAVEALLAQATEFGKAPHLGPND